MRKLPLQVQPRIIFATGAVLALAAMLVLCAPAGAQGVYAALTPPLTIVSSNSTFEIDLALTQAGTPINAYDAVVVYDPAALTFMPTSPLSLQEGSSMTGVCGSTFHLFHQSGDTLFITHSLLCNMASLAGPAPQLYRLHFKATGSPQTTVIHLLPTTQFYNEGIYVNPLYPEDAVVQIQFATPAAPKTWSRLRQLYR